MERENGLRPDLVGRIADLKPTFLRFPGGCFVEGFSVETAYRWKKTIGDITERSSHWTLWHYRTTNGLGFHEYLQLAEDLGLELMYVVNCGLTCQGRPGEHPEIITIWNTHWEVGTETKGLPVEIVDEHFYADFDYYCMYHDMYDSYDRNGPKVYVGEYAMIIGEGAGKLKGAISEAAFMTGMERNQDIVVMSSYAPLFANIHHTNWTPNLIYFDGINSYMTPTYYVQKLFMEGYYLLMEVVK